MFLTISINYLQLVRNVVSELIRQQNRFGMLSKNPITDEELEENTKWSDFNIVEPLFFNFFHGLELMMKGYLIQMGFDKTKKSHDLKELYKDFNEICPGQKKIINVLKNYLDENINFVEPLKTFFTQNNITVNKFFEVLKYPESRNTFIIYNYESIKYKAEKALVFYNQLNDDVSILISEISSFGSNNL